MSDIQEKLRRALELTAEYELLGSLAADESKRMEARKRAGFHRGVADELRRELAGQRHCPAQPDITVPTAN